MGNYCTIQQVEQRIFQPNVDERGQYEALIAAASRLIDRECCVANDFFAAAASTASDRTFYGDGTAYLKLPPYNSTIDADDVEYSDSSATVPDFTVRGDEGQYLVVDDDGYWPRNQAIVISAKWGFAAIPDEINQACIELVIAMRETSDPARERAISNAADEQFSSAKIPMRVKEVCKRWKAKRAAVFA
jgi:hypothetical protein